jgi:hypothetical protein
MSVEWQYADELEGALGGYIRVLGDQQPGSTDMSGFEDELVGEETGPFADKVYNDVFGYKCLAIDKDGKLKSPSYGTDWPAPGATLEAPEVDPIGGLGKAGIHTVKEQALQELDPYKAGFHAVCKCLVWGKVVEWERGYTSQRATVIEARIYPWYDLPADMLGVPHAARMVETVMRLYPGLHASVAYDWDPGGNDPIEESPRWTAIGYDGDLSTWEDWLRSVAPSLGLDPNDAAALMQIDPFQFPPGTYQAFKQGGGQATARWRVAEAAG